ncbi:MAG: endonuclease/exonuclease/phosphatase family protein [Bacteroidota bacterium]
MLKSIKFLFLSFLIFSINVNSQTLKLMTYNIRLDVQSDGENSWDHRKEKLASQIRFYEPDILGLQECLPNQINFLDSNLENYNHVGIGRDGKDKGESSSIFFISKKFSVLKQNTFWLSPTPDLISKGWDAALNRICTYAIFENKITKQNFWVFNTHLDHIGEVARAKSVELILKIIKSENQNNLPVIFMGDFNATPETEFILNLKKEMIDTKDFSKSKPFGPIGTFNNFEFDKPVTKRIDYIFTSNSSKIIINKYAVLSDSDNLKYPSDHLPVYVEIDF